MTLHSLRWFALALIAGAVTTTVQAVERDVAGWEGARWGMNESEIKDVFSSKLLVPLAGAHVHAALVAGAGDDAVADRGVRIAEEDERVLDQNEEIDPAHLTGVLFQPGKSALSLRQRLPL
jgi:hypothetical protein